MIDGLMAVVVLGVILRQLVLLFAASRPVPVVRGPVDAVEVVIPAFNEVRTLEATVQAVLTSDVSARVVIVDDGSTDGTGRLAERLAASHASVAWVPHARNRGKAAALTTGLRSVTGPIVVTLDADTCPAPEAVRRLVAALAEPSVAAAACHVRVAQRDAALTRWQHLEYLTGIHLGRRAQAWVGALATVAASGIRAGAVALALEVEAAALGAVVAGVDVDGAACGAGCGSFPTPERNRK